MFAKPRGKSKQFWHLWVPYVYLCLAVEAEPQWSSTPLWVAELAPWGKSLELAAANRTGTEQRWHPLWKEKTYLEQ